MAIVTLTEAKNHLRVDGTGEDTIIQLYINAAEDHISKLLNDSNPPTTGSIKAAVLLIIGDLYENREGASVKEVKANPAVLNLLHLYRKDLGV